MVVTTCWDGAVGKRGGFHFNDKNKAVPRRPMYIMPRAGKIYISLNCQGDFNINIIKTLANYDIL